MLENFSPEERLLQLIRKKKPKGRAEAVPLPTPSPRQEGPPVLKAKAKTKGKLFLSSGEEGVFPFFKKVNQVLAIGCGVLLCLFFITFLWGRIRPEPPLPERRVAEKGGTEKETPVQGESPSKPYAYYAAELEKRNIFGPSLPTEVQGPKGGTETLRDSLKDLTLLGIVSGKAPQAIIENKKEGKTLFVNQGDTVGLFQVEAILEDKVIFNYRGERLDLLL